MILDLALLLVIGNFSYASTCNPENIDLSCNNSSYPIHLTFDDGPEPYAVQFKKDLSGNPIYDEPLTGSNGQIITRNNTLTAAKILQRHQVPGTFFIMGYKFSKKELEASTKTPKSIHTEEAPAYEEIGADIPTVIEENYNTLIDLQRMGLRIGSHTFLHIDHASSKYSDSHIQNIQRPFENSNLKTYFTSPPVIRFPYGRCWNTGTNRQQCKDLLEATKNGTKVAPKQIHIGWNIDSQDWRINTQQQDKGRIHPMLGNISKSICEQKGGVVLFHEKHNATIDQLECIIEELKKAGHQFVGLEHDSLREKVNIRNSKNPKDIIIGNTAEQLHTVNSQKSLCPIQPLKSRSFTEQITQILEDIRQVRILETE